MPAYQPKKKTEKELIADIARYKKQIATADTSDSRVKAIKGAIKINEVRLKNLRKYGKAKN